MRTYYRLLLFILIPLTTISAKEKSFLITVENPLDIERRSETISLPLKDVQERLTPGDVHQLVVLDAKSKTIVTCQVTESDLLFQSDFNPRERKEFTVRVSDGVAAKPQSLVDGRFVPPREDYAWENDRIAFRMYGPALAKEVNNGIDVWTKRVRYLVVEKWYKASEGGKDAYHADHGEGADFFSVGRSLGAGGCGIWKGDSVNQPGVFSSYKTIANGPIRVAFELTYTNWKIGEKKFIGHMRISLDAGQNLNAVQVTFEGLDVNEPLQLACGLVKRNGTTIYNNEKNCWMSLWGLTTSDTVNGFLGTGIVMPTATLVKFAEDKDQYLMIGRAKANAPFTYYAGAGWTRSGDFMTVDDWNSYLDVFSRRLHAPLKMLTIVKE